MYKNIQMLRALAAISVMLFHGTGIHQEVVGSSSWFMTGIARYGYVGVDLFFVISGFVAAHTTLYKVRGIVDAPNYVYQRLARIYLGYWPFFVLSLATAAIYAPSLLDQWNWLHSFLLIFLIGVNEGRELVLYVSWSLTYELLFYALVAFTFSWTPKRVILALQVAAVCVSLTMAASLSHTPPLALWSFLAFLLEFLLGAVLRTQVHRLHNKGAIMTAVFMISAGFYLGLRGDAPQAAERALSIGTGSTGLVMLALLAEKYQYGIAPRCIIALGESSYTLYLAHVIFWSLLGYWGTVHWLSQWQPVLRTLGFWFLVFLCISLSHLYSTYIELPIHRWAISLWPRTRSQSELSHQ